MMKLQHFLLSLVQKKDHLLDLKNAENILWNCK